MYTRKGDDQQASYRLCNLHVNPLHPILCALFIFIYIIDCGYWVESFNDDHEKMSLFIGMEAGLLNRDNGSYHKKFFVIKCFVCVFDRRINSLTKS